MERDERLTILAGLPKIDLHRHLEGSLRLSTMIELGHRQGLDLPLDNPAAFAPMVSYIDGEERTLQHFLTKFHCDWYRSYADIERVTTEAVLDAADEGIVYLELRFSPEHFTRTSHLDMQGVMEAVTESGRMSASENDLQLRFLITFARERYDFDTWKHVVDLAAEMTEAGVVGVDLAGDEFAHPNQQFEKIFRRVGDTGVLGVTIHAGEGTHAVQVATAVEQLHCKRIGHGIKSIEDPAVIQLLVKRRVVLEMCPISNYQTGCVDSLEVHPLPQLDRQGVLVTINSDDPRIHRTSINDDYDVAVTAWGYTLQDLLRLEKNAIAGAFLSEEDKDALLEQVEKGYQESQGQGLL